MERKNGIRKKKFDFLSQKNKSTGKLTKVSGYEVFTFVVHKYKQLPDGSTEFQELHLANNAGLLQNFQLLKFLLHKRGLSVKNSYTEFLKTLPDDYCFATAEKYTKDKSKLKGTMAEILLKQDWKNMDFGEIKK